VVEAQHVVSTGKLVDSTEEQDVLETLIDSHKPALPASEEFAGLHYLLSTPFRYPPLRHGSRFATRDERSLWYGTRELRTAFADVAYYRLIFLAGTTAAIDRIEADMTAFRVSIRTRKAVDLTRGLFAKYLGRISSPVDYTESQLLGREMRASGVEAFRYRSARDRQGGTGIGLFTPLAFASNRPLDAHTWHSRTTTQWVEFSRKDLIEREQLAFPRSDFEVEGILPAPAP
jgi:hypothetical protein